MELPPIACTLDAGDYKARLASIAELTQDALRGFERRDLELVLWYAPEAQERVRLMIDNERACCGFLSFDLREEPDAMVVSIVAPERARGVAEELFAQFSGQDSAPLRR